MTPKVTVRNVAWWKTASIDILLSNDDEGGEKILKIVNTACIIPNRFLLSCRDECLVFLLAMPPRTHVGFYKDCTIGINYTLVKLSPIEDYYFVTLCHDILGKVAPQPDSGVAGPHT